MRLENTLGSNAGIESSSQFCFVVTDARKDHFFRVATGGQHACKLAARDDVEARAQLGEETENAEVAIRLDGKANQAILTGWMCRQCIGKSLVGIGQCGARIDVGRCAMCFGDSGQVDAFEMQMAVMVVEVAAVWKLACRHEYENNQRSIGRAVKNHLGRRFGSGVAQHGGRNRLLPLLLCCLRLGVFRTGGWLGVGQLIGGQIEAALDAAGSEQGGDGQRQEHAGKSGLRHAPMVSRKQHDHGALGLEWVHSDPLIESCHG